MEQSIWTRIIRFIKDSYSKRFKETFGGFSLGTFGFYHFFFDNVDPALVHTWIGIWLWIKTIVSAYLASLATSLGAHHVKRWTEPREEKKNPGNRRKAA